MSFKFPAMLAALLLGAGSLLSPARAATVDADTAVSFAFDLSAHGDIVFSGFGYGCNGCDGQARLLPDARMRLDFGTTVGGNDLGSRSFANPFDFAINNVGSGLTPDVSVSGALDILYVTFGYVDDVFDITSTHLNSQGSGMLVGSYAGDIQISAVPLPAGMVLMAGALGSLALLRRRKPAAA